MEFLDATELKKEEDERQVLKEEVFFPFERIRETQDKLIKCIKDCIDNKISIVVHAPTGLGKTIASIGPSLKKALKDDLTVFFLTSRHTQHKIVIETLRKIKEKFNLKELVVSDIIGKKWMCGQEGVSALYTAEFFDYCARQKDEGKCDFYNNIRRNGKLSVEAKIVFENLKKITPCHSDQIIKICLENKLCPYEMALSLSSHAKVVVADYYYIFHPTIANNFLKKSSKLLEESILIIDEGHNLPNRIRELASVRLSNYILKNAAKEAKKYGLDDIESEMNKISIALNGLAASLADLEERYISKEEIINEILKIRNNKDELEVFIKDYENAGDIVREAQKQSFIGSVASFLSFWNGPNEGYSRILNLKKKKGENFITVTYRCLDPAIISSDIFKRAYTTILMSGTLTPTEMYKDILGFPKNTLCLEFSSPFPKYNRLNLLIPKTTTKFTARNQQQFLQIAKITSEITNSVPGNSAIFFPSYEIRDNVYKHYLSMSKKTNFLESSYMTKKEKFELLEKFKEYKDVGSVLLGVAGGNFSEGIDLPGDLLKCVIVAGLPLGKPDLETKALIKYYDDKFNKGWEYGYIQPAFSKALQSAGRCIRSETDKGIIVFLDERFKWKNYFKNFPSDWDIKIVEDYKDVISDFFGSY